MFTVKSTLREETARGQIRTSRKNIGRVSIKLRLIGPSPQRGGDKPESLTLPFGLKRRIGESPRPKSEKDRSATKKGKGKRVLEKKADTAGTEQKKTRKGDLKIPNSPLRRQPLPRRQGEGETQGAPPSRAQDPARLKSRITNTPEILHRKLRSKLENTTLSEQGNG